MLADFPTEILFALMCTIPVICLVGGLMAKSLAIVKYRKKHTRTLLLILTMNILSILVTAASFVFNMGWFRFFLIILSIPFIHSFIYTVTNIVMIKAIDKSFILKVICVCSFITYVLAYAFFSDGGDYGGMYCFFGLIRNETLVSLGSGISSCMATLHIVLYITQIVLGIVFALEGRKQIKLTEGTCE